MDQAIERTACGEAAIERDGILRQRSRLVAHGDESLVDGALGEKCQLVRTRDTGIVLEKRLGWGGLGGGVDCGLIGGGGDKIGVIRRGRAGEDRRGFDGIESRRQRVFNGLFQDGRIGWNQHLNRSGRGCGVEDVVHGGFRAGVAPERGALESDGFGQGGGDGRFQNKRGFHGGSDLSLVIAISLSNQGGGGGHIGNRGMQRAEAAAC